MENLSDILNIPTRNYRSIDDKQIKNYRSIERIKQKSDILTTNQADKIIDSVDDLIDDKKYKPFFFKKLYKLGPTIFLQIAESSRKAKYPGHYFTSCLRKTVDNHLT